MLTTDFKKSERQLLLTKKINTIFHDVNIDSETITFTANTEEEMVAAVNAFANSYLGYQFAGTDRQKINLSNTTPQIPESGGIDTPWMEKREV